MSLLASMNSGHESSERRRSLMGSFLVKAGNGMENSKVPLASTLKLPMYRTFPSLIICATAFLFACAGPGNAYRYSPSFARHFMIGNRGNCSKPAIGEWCSVWKNLVLWSFRLYMGSKYPWTAHRTTLLHCSASKTRSLTKGMALSIYSSIMRKISCVFQQCFVHWRHILNYILL